MKLGIGVIVFYVALVGLCGYGWVHNIISIAGSDFGKITGMLALRVIGIFVAPIGVVIGYF